MHILPHQCQELWCKMKFIGNVLYFFLAASFAGANVILRTDPYTTVEGSEDVRVHEEDPEPRIFHDVMVCTVLVLSSVGSCLFLCFCYTCQCKCRGFHEKRP